MNVASQLPAVARAVAFEGATEAALAARGGPWRASRTTTPRSGSGAGRCRGSNSAYNFVKCFTDDGGYQTNYIEVRPRAVEPFRVSDAV